MKLIPLTRGLFAQVDDEDFEHLSQYSWCVTGGVYAGTNISGKGMLMHRLLMSPGTGLVVDHIDQNPINNQRSNLRLCTNTENLRNRGRVLPLDGRLPSSEFKGVYPRIKSGMVCYSAGITVGGLRRHLGIFDSAISAAIAYNRACKELHGEFACLNPVEDDGSPLIKSTPRPNKTSGFRGVCKHSSGLWAAQFTHNKTTEYLGAFKTEETAAIAYNRRAREVLGPSAYQNNVADSGAPLKIGKPDKRINSSKFQGVCKTKRGSITAFIGVQGKPIYLGTFKTEEEAARRWDEEARLLGRPEHKMNFPKQN